MEPAKRYISHLPNALRWIIVIWLAFWVLYSVGWHCIVRTGSCEPTLLVGDRVLVNKLVYRIFPVKRGDLVVFDDPEYDYNRNPWYKAWWRDCFGWEIEALGLPKGPSVHIKRVIAIPGDSIEGRVEDGKTVVYLNGEKCNELYINDFTLLRLRKEIGLIAAKRLWHIPIPSFLRKKSKDILCSYDPTKELNNQPLYLMDESEIVRHPYTHKPQLIKPFGPSSAVDFGNPDFLYSIDIFGPYCIPEGKYWIMGDNRQDSRDSRSWGLLDGRCIRGRVRCILTSIDSHNPTWIFDVCAHPVNFFKHQIRFERFFKKIAIYN